MINSLKNLVAILTAGVILSTSPGCFKPTPPHDPFTYSIQPRKGDVTPWEADFAAHPEKYPGLTTRFPRDVEVIRAYYKNKGVTDPWATHRYSGAQCPADTCPRDYLTLIQVFYNDRHIVEEDGWQEYHGPF